MWMWTWIGSCWLNRQVETVSPMSLSPMALSLMSLSQMSLSRMYLSPKSLSPMSLSLRCALDGLVGKEWTSPRVVEEAMIVVFRLRLGSCLVRFLCSNLFISGIHYYTCCKVFGSLKVYLIYGFCTGLIFIGFSLFIELWDIVHAEFLQLLAFKEPPCDGIAAQLVSWKYCELTHEAAQAQHQLSSLYTVYTPLLTCRWQCQRRPLSVALNFHVERSSP